MTDSQRLLVDYAENGSEPAFRELVERYLGLVYSTAIRLVNGDAHLAQDVTQTVFLNLARKARGFSGEVMLGGWLHRHTCYVAANVRRSERRRKLRESEAAEMNAFQDHTESNLAEIASVLDEAINQLGAQDRAAILLRFFEQRDFRAVGESLGSNEDAARMRVGRALEKLHTLLKRRGVAFSVAGLGAALATGAVSAAPAGMATGISATALSGAATGGTTVTLAKLLALTKLKLAAGGVVVAAGLLVGTVVMLDQPGPVSTDTPNPLALLKGVTEARQKVKSGEMELDVAQFEFSLPFQGTNHTRLRAVFNGQNRRFESFRREYSYVPVEPDAIKAVDARMVAEGLDQEAAVRAGLLKGFESHHLVAYDGSVVMDYWANDGKPVSTTLDDPTKGSPSFIFDPRCLGLWNGSSVGSTLESCLPCDGAKSLELVGRETVEGVSAWHVRLVSKYDDRLDFWVAAAHPQRLVKEMHFSSVVVSKYDDANPKDPIPIQVEVTDCETTNGAPRFEQEFTRTKAQFGIRVDPASWTLAGLNMSPGTEVVDVRKMLRIGYWNGSGLQANPPPGSPAWEVPIPTAGKSTTDVPHWQAKYPSDHNYSQTIGLIALTLAGAVILTGIFVRTRKKRF